MPPIGGRGARVPFTIKRGQGSYKLHTQMIYRSTKQIFFFKAADKRTPLTGATTDKPFHSSVCGSQNDQKIAGEINAYKHIFEFIKKKKNRKRVYSLIFQLSYQKKQRTNKRYI